MSAIWMFVAVIVLVVIAQVVIRALVPKAPAEKTYACARCGSRALHGDRTVFAWTRGERKFYCDPCNQAWLESCTPEQRAKYERNMARMARSQRS